MQISTQSTIKKFIRQVCLPWNSIPLIDRWLIGQIMPPMLFAISAFTVISLSVGVMFDLIRKIVEYNLPLLTAIKALFYSLPSFLVLSFPMAVLLSTLLSYGKLSSNSELLALKSLGINTSRIITPAIIVSIFMTGLTFYFNDNLVPASNKLAESTLRSGIGSSFNNGNKRTDLLNIIRANHTYYPDTLKIPINEKGRLSFKLDQIAPFNGIKDFNAHDALGDAVATIKLAEIINLQNPKMWEASLLTASRESANNEIENNKLFCITETFFGKIMPFVVSFICYHPVYKWAQCFDLKHDPELMFSEKLNVFLMSDAILSPLSLNPLFSIIRPV